MKKGYKLALSGALAMAMFSGCVGIAEKDQSLPVINHDNYPDKEKLKLNTPAVDKAKVVMDNNVTGAFYKMPVSKAVEQLSSQINISVDSSFLPAETYLFSGDVNSSFGDFLKRIRKTSGIDYRFRDNALYIVNKSLIEENINGTACSANEAPSVIINVKEPVYPGEIIKLFADRFGMSFVYKTRYYELNGLTQDGLVPAKKVTFNYSGCDKEEAFKTFLRANNLIAEQTGPKAYTVRDYEIATIDTPLYFNYKFTSSSASSSSGSSSSSSSSSTSSGLSAASGVSVSESESQKDTLEQFIRKIISPKGTADVSQRGYITIVDTPDNVRAAKKLLLKEIEKQRPLNLKISILRIDLSNGVNAGVDWSVINQTLLGTKINAGYNFASTVSGGASLVIDSAKMPTVISALETYGKTRIVREFSTVAKMGTLNSFKSVEKIPYMTSTVTSTGTTSQANLEAREAEAGIIINVTPRIDASGEVLDMSTSITISELVEMVTFSMASGEFKLPKINSNEINVPAKINMDQMLILTGFKMSKKQNTKQGVPGAVNVPVAGFLFGNEKDDDVVSELAIIVSPSTVEEL
ncbi:MAG: hypothetical protein PHV62_03305 [Sulfuricurvum sp.]|nr:hypothetical protein [Sulfuricurvum sp.]